MFDVIILTGYRYVNPEKTVWYIVQVLLEDKLLQTVLEKKGKKNELLFYIYNDGTVEKKLTIE